MQKVLVIGYVWPEPQSSAAGTLMMSILRTYKQKGWHVTFASPAQTTEYMIDLAEEGIVSQSITLNCDSFDDYLRAFQPTIVHFDRFMMEEQFGWRVDEHCPDALKLLDTVDLQFLRGARQQAHKENRAVTQQDLHSELAMREIAAILRCDLSLIISAYEMSLLSDAFNIDPIVLHHLPFMVETATLPKKRLSFSKRQHFMTIGNFKHAPNWDAILYLQAIWPLIRQKLPQAELHIYGAYAPPKAQSLHNPKTGFLIKGRAEHALSTMEQARVCLAPLRFGAGLKGKLLDAMIAQTPSVTTSIGAEGMLAPDTTWPGAIADNIEGFADAAVTLYSDENKWTAAQTNALHNLSRQFEANSHAAELITKIQTVSQQLTHHRQQNFIGAMLKHHTMRSTKYLSKWIMEKNKT